VVPGGSLFSYSYMQGWVLHFFSACNLVCNGPFYLFPVRQDLGFSLYLVSFFFLSRMSFLSLRSKVGIAKFGCNIKRVGKSTGKFTKLNFVRFNFMWNLIL